MTLVKEAYAIVRRRIMSGEFALGAAVSRRRIAAELGMSLVPVSEALIRLECEGLLESRLRAGTRVPMPSLEDVDGQYAIREALEVQAARAFIEAGTAADVTRLRRLAGRLDGLNASGPRTLYVELHREFHSQIARCSGCRALTEAVERAHALASAWFCAMSSPPANEGTSRHIQLVDALASRDPELAIEAVREHVAFGRKHARQVLAPYFEARKAIENRFSRVSAPRPATTSSDH